MTDNQAPAHYVALNEHREFLLGELEKTRAALAIEIERTERIRKLATTGGPTEGANTSEAWRERLVLLLESRLGEAEGYLGPGGWDALRGRHSWSWTKFDREAMWFFVVNTLDDLGAFGMGMFDEGRDDPSITAGSWTRIDCEDLSENRKRS